jgi:predicted nucleotidyltransferase
MELATDLTVDDTVLRAFCREHGIRSLRLFGSAVRNELRDDSDIDLLAEFEPGRLHAGQLPTRPRGRRDPAPG